MFLSSEQHKVSKCQHRASQAHYQYALSPNLTVQEILSTLNTALNSVHVTLTFNPRDSNETRTVKVMDTERGLLADNRFYLLHWEDHGLYHWNLRRYSAHICGSSPSVSMEVLPNVDYEKAQYRASSVMIPHILNNTHHFLLSSTLSTNDPNRILTFVQLESVFPGLYALSSADDSVAAKDTYTYRNYGDGDLYFNSEALDITIRIQGWKKDGKSLFWSVAMSTISIPSETALVALHRSLESSFLANRMVCRSKACMNPESFFFGLTT